MKYLMGFCCSNSKMRFTKSFTRRRASLRSSFRSIFFSSDEKRTLSYTLVVNNANKWCRPLGSKSTSSKKADRSLEVSVRVTLKDRPYVSFLEDSTSALDQGMFGKRNPTDRESPTLVVRIPAVRPTAAPTTLFHTLPHHALRLFA